MPGSSSVDDDEDCRRDSSTRQHLPEEGRDRCGQHHVVEDDLPPTWYRPALAVDDNASMDCGC